MERSSILTRLESLSGSKGGDEASGSEHALAYSLVGIVILAPLIAVGGILVLLSIIS